MLKAQAPGVDERLMSVGSAAQRLLLTCIALALLLVAVPVAHAARAWQAPQELSTPIGDAWIGKPIQLATFDALGNGTVAWLENGDGNRTIIARDIPRIGEPGPRQVLGGGYNYPTVASGRLGRPLVAWVGSTTPGSPGTEVLVAEQSLIGAFSAPEVVAHTGQFYNQPGASVAANSLGDAVVAYVDGDRVMRVRRDPLGGWGAAEPVTGSLGASVWRIAAVMSETGEAAYTWYSWTPAQGNRSGVVTESPAGTRTAPRMLNAADRESGAPSIAMNAAGNAIVTWLELKDGRFAGPIRAAVKGPGLPFGPAIDLDGSASDYAGAPVALSAAGVAVIAYGEAHATTATGGYVGSARAIVGLVPAGVFRSSEPVHSDLVSPPVTVAADPLGNALFFFNDWDTYEPRVVRRSVTGQYGQARNAVPCPDRGVYPVAANVDATGDATLLWVENNFLKRNVALMASRDRAADAFSPDPCPPHAPWLKWTENPQPGQQVDFDAVGADDPDAARVSFEWDMDNDGTFELSTGSDRHASATFATAGVHRIGLRVVQYSHNEGNSVGMTCVFEIRVGLAPLPPETWPDPWGTDPRPPDLPAESPWPTGPGPQLPGLPGVPSLPLPDLGLVRDGRARSAAGVLNIRQPKGLALAISAAAVARRADVERHGLPVTIRAARSGRVRLRMRAGRTLVSRSVSLKANRPRVVRLKPAKRLRSSLKAAVGRRLLVDARAKDGSATRTSARLRR